MKVYSMSSLLRSFLCLGCLFQLGFSSANAQGANSASIKPPEGQSYRSGLKSIVIPSPAAELSEMGSDYRVLMESAVPDSNRLIAAFLLPEDFANVRAGISKPASRYAMVETLRRAEFAEFDPDTFKQVSESVAQQFGTTLDVTMKDEQEELNHKLKAVRGALDTVTLDKPIPLGSFFIKPDACGFGMIMPLSSAGTTVKMVAGMTILRVQNRLIYTFV